MNTQTQAHKTAHVQQQPGREEEAQKDRDSMYNSLSRSRERVTMQRMRMNNLSSSETWGRGGRQERESESEGGSGVVGGNRILLTGFGQPVSVLEVWACEQCMFLRVCLRVLACEFACACACACALAVVCTDTYIVQCRYECRDTDIIQCRSLCVQFTAYVRMWCVCVRGHVCVCVRMWVCAYVCSNHGNFRRAINELLQLKMGGKQTIHSSAQF